MTLAGQSRRTAQTLDGRAVSRALLAWYARASRDLPWRRSGDPYRVWVSEIMLQQTQVERVKEFFPRFLKRFPTIDVLAEATEHDVLRLWEGLGYYRRARQLHAAAKTIVGKHGSRWPRSVAALRTLPGIGRYTAGAIASIAMNLPEPIVEANSRRVIARLAGHAKRFDRPGDDEPIWEIASSMLPKKNAGRFNQALMDLGAMVCTPIRPLCTECPVKRWCEAMQSDRVSEIPAKSRRLATRRLHEAAVVVVRGKRVLVERRKADEWWAGLWDFPRLPLAVNRKNRPQSAETICYEVSLLIDRSAALEGINLDRHEHLGTIAHAVTHHRITLEIVRCRGARSGDRRPEQKWVLLSDLASLALSSPGRKIASLIGS